MIDSQASIGLHLNPQRLLRNASKKLDLNLKLLAKPSQSNFLSQKKEDQESTTQREPFSSETLALELRTGNSRISSCNSVRSKWLDSSRIWRQVDQEDSLSSLFKMRERHRLLNRQMERSLMEEAWPSESLSHKNQEVHQEKEEKEMNEKHIKGIISL